MENLEKSVLELNKLYFDKIEFDCDRNENYSGKELEFKFEKQTEFDESGTRFRVLLTCILKEKNDTMHLNVRVVGEFTLECDDEKTKDTLVKKNSLTVLFPYLRSMISLLTSQAGIPTIVLPVVNIAEMFND